MNKVITINLNGTAHQLEEDGYEALRSYLDTAARRLEGNPDQAEIMADIEQAIADKFRATLGVGKTVVVTAAVTEALAEMGPVEDGSESPRNPQAETAGSPGPAAAPAAASPKRLFKVHDGAMIAGVCNGLAAYLNIDVTIVRVLFAVFSFFYGLGVLVYLLLAFLLPSAHTSAEKASAHGAPSTAQEFIRRAREGYYEGMRTFGDRRASREWRRRFKREMRAWKRDFKWEACRSAPPRESTWDRPGAEPPRVVWGSWIVCPALGVLRALIVLVSILAVFSLLAGGHAPVPAPAGRFHPWAEILIIVIAANLVLWLLKSLARPFRLGRGWSPFLWLWDSLLWLGVVLFVFWYAGHHSAQVHDAVRDGIAAVRDGFDALRQWWDERRQ